MKKTKTDLAENPTRRANAEFNAQTRVLLKLWRANREFRMRDTPFEDYEKLGAEYDALLGKIDARNRELTKMRRERDRLVGQLVVFNARVRSGMRGYFGHQSPEFAQIKTRSHQAGRKTRQPAPAKSELPPEPGASPAS